jgi:hypothetical protein
MKLTVIAKGTYSVKWPVIEIFVNDQHAGSAEVQDLSELDFDITLDQEQNYIRIHYSNKEEHHTVIDRGKIISDQSVELLQIRLDDILLATWVLTEAHYEPEYFAGFRLSNPEAPVQLKSQLIWHFPGNFILPAVPEQSKFWFWYRDQRRFIHIKQYSDKDGYREENYIGSLDPLTDLIQEIENVLDIQ